MKKLILTAVISMLSASAFASAFTDAGFAGSLNSIGCTAVQNIKADKAEPIKPARYAPPTASTYVSVSSYVSLNGNGFMPPNGGYTSVNMTGWATFRDSSGKITSNSTYINTTASMWLYPNQFASQTVWPNISVQLYRDGKYVGTANVSGSINVTGWPSSGSFVSLSGSGYLNGSAYVDDAR